MPPLALIGAGIAGSAIGAGFSQAAANKGPQALFPGLQKQGVSALGGPNGVGANSFGSLNQLITNPGKMPDVSATVNPAFDALVNANKQFTQEGLAQVKQQFGSQGLGSSSSAAIGTSDYLTNSNAQFMSILAQYTLQAQQQAQQTQLAATGAGLNAFMGPAFTDKGPKGSIVGSMLGTGSSGIQQLGLLQAMGMI